MIDDVAKQTIQQVAAAGNKEKKAVERKQIVVFELDREEYASAIDDLREIIKMREVTPIPGSPAFIAGIVNVRGQIVVVIDLEKRFMLKRDNASSPLHIIIVEVEENIFGIIVDEVTGVLRVPVDSIKATPAMVTSKISSDYVKGVIVLDKEAAMADATEETKKGQVSRQMGGQAPLKDQKSETRLLLLLDIPRMLSEKELQQFSKIIQETTKEKPVSESVTSSVNDDQTTDLKPKPDLEVKIPTDKSAWKNANQSPLAQKSL
jgi:purine-binding chemotaxis protein CheW